MQKMDFPKNNNTQIYNVLQKAKIYRIIYFRKLPEVVRSYNSLIIRYLTLVFFVPYLYLTKYKKLIISNMHHLSFPASVSRILTSIVLLLINI